MTTYATAGFWYDSDPVTGEITAFGESTLEWVTRDGTTSYSWSYGADPGDGSLPPVSFDPPFVNTRIDGEIRDGTSNTIFLFEFDDGLTSTATPTLNVKDPATGRTWLYPLGGDPFPPFETVEQLTGIFAGTSNTISQIEDGDFAPDQPIGITDGTSNTILIGENDLVQGDDGRDAFWGGLGRDRIWGYEGNDTLYGEAGNDLLKGGLDDDNLFGGTGDDALDGGTGGDRAFGADGADAISGGAGQDALFGGTGDDTMRGGGGHDLVAGGAGDDLLFGGAGNDVFLFHAGDGSDRVRDFDADKLALDIALVGTATSGAEVVASYGTEADGDLVLVLEGGMTIRLIDVLAADVAAAIEIV